MRMITITVTAFALATVLASSPAMAQSDSTSAGIHARIVQSVGVSDTKDMTFAWLARPAYPGKDRVAPIDRLLSAGLAMIKADGGKPAKIVISGAPNQTVGLLVGKDTKLYARSRGLMVSGFSHNGGAMPALNPAGKATIELGATLSIAANTSNGRYLGVFDVIVSNN